MYSTQLSLCEYRFYIYFHVLYSTEPSSDLLKSIERHENIAQGGPHQKRDLVDAYTHASCAACHNMAKQRALPTL